MHHDRDPDPIVLVIGPCAPELEAVEQALAAAGIVSTGIIEPEQALTNATTHPPIAVVVSRVTATDWPQLLLLPRAPGGAVLLWHPFDGHEATPPAAQHRMVLADLALPLERYRMVSLIRHLLARARDAGRTADHSPDVSATEPGADDRA